MIDRFGWTSDKWDAMSHEAKVMTIASLEYWDEIRSKKSKNKLKKNQRVVKERVI